MIETVPTTVERIAGDITREVRQLAQDRLLALRALADVYLAAREHEGTHATGRERRRCPLCRAAARAYRTLTGFDENLPALLKDLLRGTRYAPYHPPRAGV